MSNEIEEEEFDEPLLVTAKDGTANAEECACSNEYLEAIDALANDPWDVSSWIVYLEEVLLSRSGGLVSIADAYKKILSQFPLSAMFWRKLAEHHIKNKEYSLAHAAFASSLDSCRNVDLWRSYLSLVTLTTADPILEISSTTQKLVQHKKLEAEYERAILSIGYCVDSSSIWWDYVQLLRAMPVAENNILEAGKKIAALRSLLQRAVCVPTEGVDALWQEYELFEKTHGGTGTEGTGEAALAEFNKRYLHAKSILRDRKRLTAGIEFDRLACPPAHSVAETQQLELWSQWIR